MRRQETPGTTRCHCGDSILQNSPLSLTLKKAVRFIFRKSLKYFFKKMGFQPESFTLKKGALRPQKM